MVNDNSLSDSVLIQIGVLEKDIKGLKDTLYSLEHSGESGRGYDRQVANIKNQIQQKTKQIQQFKRSINMNDAMDQLAMIGITQDARSVSEIQREFDYWDKGYEYFSERYLYWKSIYESTKEAKAKVDMENYKKKRDEANKKRKEFANEMSRTALNKDDDATEHSSIETYGKEKETETMPLEKDPVQAQDAHQNGEHVKVKNHGTGELVDLKVLKDNGDGTLEVKAPTGAVITIKESWIVKDEEPIQDAYTPGSYDPKRHEINLMKIDYEISKWRQTVANLKQRIAGLERMNSSGDYGKATARELQEAKRDQEAAYMRLQQALSMKQRATGQKDEVPTDVKDTKADGDPETMTTKEAREYWNKYHNSDPILEDYPSFEAWYRESKLNGYIVDHVQDSYEMLKLCGIIS